MEDLPSVHDGLTGENWMTGKICPKNYKVVYKCNLLLAYLCVLVLPWVVEFQV